MHIGLIGCPGSGKDVVADFLVSKYGYRRLAFADKIKELYYRDSGFSEEEFKSSRNTDIEKEIRSGLWEYSDRMRSKYNRLYFIIPVIEEVKVSSTPVVLSDIRTLDELDEAEKANVKIMLITRKTNDKQISETRIPKERLSLYPVFHNDSDSLEVAHKEFDVFLKRTSL